MISLNCMFEKTLEIPDDGLHPHELIKLARKKKLIKTNPNKKSIELKDGEFAVPMKEDGEKKWGVNPLTGRKKKQKVKRYLKTTIKPKDRTLKNLPRYANKKAKVRFQDWLGLKKSSISSHSVGQAYDGAWYGWSHRAIYGFRIGTKIKPGDIGNKYEYGKEQNKKYNELHTKDPEAAEKYRKSLRNFEPYEIKTDEEAKEHAIRFAEDVA